VPTGTVIWDIIDRDRMTYLGPSRQPVKAIEAGAEGVFQWFTYERKPRRVLTYKADSRVARQVGSGAPLDVAADGQGRLYILDENKGVTRYSATLSSNVNVASGLSRPIALDVDPMGNVYVLDRTGKIDVFGPGGQKLESLGPGLPGGASLTNPVDIAVDDTGRLFLLSDKPGALYVLE
jgi:sugar lactone lactonase YvrE